MKRRKSSKRRSRVRRRSPSTTRGLARGDVPVHVFSIPDLDFSSDLFGDRLAAEWFTLGIYSIGSEPNARGVEDVTERQSLLLPTGDFARVFDALDAVGNILHGLGEPQQTVRSERGHKLYQYVPFYRFEISSTNVLAEPLIFLHSTGRWRFFMNPDLPLFLRLEERAAGSGIWWDPRRGVDVLRQRVIEQSQQEIVEIRTDHLLRYLRARQMSLVVGHYRQLHLQNPLAVVGRFTTGDLTLGSHPQRIKAILQNWGLRRDVFGRPPFLQRRLHLWFEIPAPTVDVEEPWTELPPFDPYTFTLPTAVGWVAPARWRLTRRAEGRTFEGETCDFMGRVFFRQDVLTKYEGASGFEVKDDGSVSCRSYWGLVRSTGRLGNELLSTAIGDFAEGVPFEEWPHWRQYAVPPPSPEMVTVLGSEPTIPDLVNRLAATLRDLNTAFARFAASLGVAKPRRIWAGSLESLAGRQLKWVYPANAADDEFLKRATLLSTLIIDGLVPPALRDALVRLGPDLHVNEATPPGPLGSRNLLQRVALVAAIKKDLRPNPATIPVLVRQADGKAPAGEPDTQGELARLHRGVRDDFAPLAFLYDLRVAGGVAHAPNKARASDAAELLGLPRENWHRANYLDLLRLVTDAIRRITARLEGSVGDRGDLG